MSSMSVRTFMKVAPSLPASTSILLRGKHGIGKSQIVKQVAVTLRASLKLEKNEFPVIDRRLSQVSEGDIIGLPSTDGEVTRFNPPDWYKRACSEPCVLFLDELNRATPEVMQAAFQIVLDRELNGWKLHPQTRVFSAINSSAEYNVNEVDPALLDRFWVIDLDPDIKDWLTWAKSSDSEFGGNLHYSVIDFIEHENKWLDTPKGMETGKVTTSRRSWERLSNALVYAKIADDPNNELFYPICFGYVGIEAAARYIDYTKSLDLHITGEDILNKYSKLRERIMNKARQEMLNTAIEKVAEHIEKLDKLSDRQGKNLAAFMSDLSGELRISLWTKIYQFGVNKMDLAKSVHKHCAKLILDVFGVPLGPAGIGVVPNIPTMFQDKQESK